MARKRNMPAAGLSAAGKLVTVAGETHELHVGASEDPQQREQPLALIDRTAIIPLGVIDQQRHVDLMRGPHRRALEKPRPPSVPRRADLFADPVVDVRYGVLRGELVNGAHRNSGGEPFAVAQQPGGHKTAVRSAGDADARTIPRARRFGSIRERMNVGRIQFPQRPVMQFA